MENDLIDKENLMQEVADLQAQGYSYQQIADELEISKSKVSRTMEKIRETEQNETEENGTYQHNETARTNEISHISEQRNETNLRNETEEKEKLKLKEEEIEKLKNQLKFKKDMQFTLPIKPKEYHVPKHVPQETRRNETKYVAPIVPTETELQIFYNAIVDYVNSKNEEKIFLSKLKELIENVEIYITQAGVYASEMDVDEEEFAEVKALNRLLDECLNPLLEDNPQRQMDFYCEEDVISDLEDAYNEDIDEE